MNGVDPYLKAKDFLVSKEEFELLWDKEKDMLITHPQPKKIEKYYEHEDYISHNDKDNTLIGRLYFFVKNINFRRKVKLVKSFVGDKGNLLDIGTGTGFFVSRLKMMGWEVSGMEPNEKARSIAKKKGVEVFKSLEDLGDRQYDAVTLWHVLEHMPNLNVVAKKLTGLVAKGGCLIIAVPNFKSLDALHYKEYWAAFDVPRHLSHFSKSSITKLFEHHDFEVVLTKPMVFDAFYISLLSEKYKTGKSNYIRAIYQGLRSNLNGLKTGEYSSMQYVLQRRE